MTDEERIVRLTGEVVFLRGRIADIARVARSDYRLGLHSIPHAEQLTMIRASCDEVDDAPNLLKEEWQSKPLQS